MVYIGIDNGITGSIGIINGDKTRYYKMPIKPTLNYQKTKIKHINRIDTKKLKEILLENTTAENFEKLATRTLIERPMVNTQRFEATTSALRALEAVLITLEEVGIGYEFIDSKEWQRKLLPYMQCSKEEFSRKIKEISLERAKQIFPTLDFADFKDGDGLLIAWYANLTKEGEK